MSLNYYDSALIILTVAHNQKYIFTIILYQFEIIHDINKKNHNYL